MRIASQLNKMEDTGDNPTSRECPYFWGNVHVKWSLIRVARYVYIDHTTQSTPQRQMEPLLTKDCLQVIDDSWLSRIIRYAGQHSRRVHSSSDVSFLVPHLLHSQLWAPSNGSGPLHGFENFIVSSNTNSLSPTCLFSAMKCECHDILCVLTLAFYFLLPCTVFWSFTGWGVPPCS